MVGFDLDLYGRDLWGWLLGYGERFPDYQALARATDPNFYTGEGNWPTFFKQAFRKSEFKTSFINRFSDHLNTSFKPEVTLKVLEDMAAITGKEIREHVKRWGYPTSYQDWQEKVEYIRAFMEERPLYQVEHLLEYFDLAGTAKVNLKTNPQKGTIKINTIEIKEGTKGVDNPASWQGVYFKGVPVEITAIPKVGYKFVGWEGSEQSSRATLTLNLSGDVELKAVFE